MPNTTTNHAITYTNKMVSRVVSTLPPVRSLKKKIMSFMSSFFIQTERSVYSGMQLCFSSTNLADGFFLPRTEAWFTLATQKHMKGGYREDKCGVTLPW